MFILVVGCGVPNEKYPGNGIFEFDQAKALSEYGHKVIYVAIDLRSIRRWRSFGVNNINKDGIEVYNYSFPLGRVGDKILDFFGRKGFRKIYKRIGKKLGKPDIVHAHFADVAIYVEKECKKNSIPLVITEHSSKVNVPELKEKTSKRLKSIYESSSALIAVGATLAERIELHTGLQPIVIPNIVALDSFELSFKRTNGEFRFISAGNLNYGKGFDILVSAFARVCKQHSNVKLTIMGAGPEEKKLKDLCNILNINEWVAFTGKYVRNEFAHELIGSDVFVLASRGETFGVVYIEAMAAGLPVIATRCGGPEDFVTEENGMLVQCDNIIELASAMEKMYTDFNTYDREKIRNGMVEKFSGKQIANRLTKVYDDLLK